MKTAETSDKTDDKGEQARQKFLGAYLSRDTVAVLEAELVRRISAGENVSRASLIREAIVKTYTPAEAAI